MREYIEFINPLGGYRRFIERELDEFCKRVGTLNQVLGSLYFLTNGGKRRVPSDVWLYSVAANMMVGDSTKTPREAIRDSYGFKEAFEAHYDIRFDDESSFKEYSSERSLFEPTNVLEEIWTKMLGEEENNPYFQLNHRINGVVGQWHPFISEEEREFFTIALLVAAYSAALKYVKGNGMPLRHYVEKEYVKLIRVAYPFIEEYALKFYGAGRYAKDLKESDEQRLKQMLTQLTTRYVKRLPSEINPSNWVELDTTISYVYDLIRKMESVLRLYGKKIEEFNNLKIKILFELKEEGLWELYQQMKRKASRILEGYKIKGGSKFNQSLKAISASNP